VSREEAEEGLGARINSILDVIKTDFFSDAKVPKDMANLRIFGQLAQIFALALRGVTGRIWL
jgi:hypothetical protein